MYVSLDPLHRKSRPKLVVDVRDANSQALDRVGSPGSPILLSILTPREVSMALLTPRASLNAPTEVVKQIIINIEYVQSPVEFSTAIVSLADSPEKPTLSDHILPGNSKTFLAIHIADFMQELV